MVSFRFGFAFWFLFLFSFSRLSLSSSSCPLSFAFSDQSAAAQVKETFVAGVVSFGVVSASGDGDEWFAQVGRRHFRDARARTHTQVGCCSGRTRVVRAYDLNWRLVVCKCDGDGDDGRERCLARLSLAARGIGKFCHLNLARELLRLQSDERLRRRSDAREKNLPQPPAGASERAQWAQVAAAWRAVRTRIGAL